MKTVYLILSIIIWNTGCTPVPIIPNPPDPEPTDSIPPDPINPLYDFELLWALPMLPDTGYSANRGLPRMYQKDLLMGAQFNWYEGGYDQHLILLNPDTQEEIWKWDEFNSPVGNRSFREHLIMNNIFYGSDQQRIFAIDLSTGNTIWQRDAQYSKLTSSDGFLFYSTNPINDHTLPANLYKYNPADNTHELIYHIAGDEHWYNFINKSTQIYDENGDELIYFIHAAYRHGPYQDTTILYCYNNDINEILWQYGTSDGTHPNKQPIIDEDRIYFGTAHNIYCLNKQTGALIWKEKSTHTNFSGSYILVEGKILRISNEGHFKALDKMTGAIVYEYDYGSAYSDDMEYLDGRVYYADGGQLNIIEVSSGKRLYRWKTKNDIKSSLNFIDQVALDPERGVMYVSDWAYMNCIRIPE